MDEGLKNEKLLRALNEAAEGISIADANDRYIYVNKAHAAIYGYAAPEELIGKTWLDITPKEVAEAAKKKPDTLHDKKVGSFFGELPGLRKDGTQIPTKLHAKALWSDQGGYDGHICVVSDITEHKEAEDALRKLSGRQEAILAAIPDIVAEVDVNKKYTWMNDAGREFFGPDVIGKEAAFYFVGEQKTYQAVSPIFEGSEDTIYVESWQKRKDGEKRLLAWWCRTLRGADGVVAGALSTARDITDQYALQVQLEMASRLPAENPNPVLRIDDKGTIMYANDVAQKLLGCWQERGGAKISTLKEHAIAAIDQQKKEILEVPCEMTERVYSFVLVPIADRQYANLYGRDITDQKKAKEEIAGRVKELEKMNDLMVGRELKMIELKRRIKELESGEKGSGEQPKEYE